MGHCTTRGAAALSPPLAEPLQRMQRTAQFRIRQRGGGCMLVSEVARQQHRSQCAYGLSTVRSMAAARQGEQLAELLVRTRHARCTPRA